MARGPSSSGTRLPPKGLSTKAITPAADMLTPEEYRESEQDAEVLLAIANQAARGGGWQPPLSSAEGDGEEHDDDEEMVEDSREDSFGGGEDAERRTLCCPEPGCGQRFVHRSAMKRHMRRHTGDLPYLCTHPGCGKAFRESGALTMHTRVHTGERPFICDHRGCGKAFKASGALSRHQRVHSDERRFACKFDGCQKAFKDSCALTVHMRVHTGERPYRCEYPGCGKSFMESGTLTRHKELHLSTRSRTPRARVRPQVVASVSTPPPRTVTKRTATDLGLGGPEHGGVWLNSTQPCLAPTTIKVAPSGRSRAQPQQQAVQRKSPPPQRPATNAPARHEEHRFASAAQQPPIQVPKPRMIETSAPGQPPHFFAQASFAPPHSYWQPHPFSPPRPHDLICGEQLAFGTPHAQGSGWCYYSPGVHYNDYASPTTTPMTLAGDRRERFSAGAFGQAFGSGAQQPSMSCAGVALHALPQQQPSVEPTVLLAPVQERMRARALQAELPPANPAGETAGH